MTDKEFRSIDEQLKILSSRGLTIHDEEKAKDFLLKHNYYRISGYSLTLRKNDVFSKRASFQNIVDIYNFDHEFRHLILQYIDIIEVQMKSIYAYEFSKVHGATGYLNPELFTDPETYQKTMDKANEQKKRRLPNEAYLKHFVRELHQDIPLWAYVDLFTISDISFLYSITESGIQDAIAKNFGLNTRQGARILGKYMHSMTIIRNLCAHGSRIYNRLFEQKPSLNKNERALLRTRKNGEMDNAHFYGFYMIMKRMLPREQFLEMHQKLISLTEKYSFVRMDYYGFRNDWKEKMSC